MDIDLSKFEIDEEVQKQIQSEVKKTINSVKEEFETNTAGLKKSKEDLLKELKAEREKTSGLDVDKINGLLTQIESEKEASMIKNGQIDELVNMRVNTALAEQGDQIKNAQERAKEYEAKYNETVQINNNMQIENSLTMAAGKVEDLLPTAIPDILTRAKQTWRVKDGELVAYQGDKQLFDQEGNPLSGAQWIESLRESAPHYFSRAKGTGASGNNGSAQQKLGNIGGSRKDRAAYVANKYNLPLN